MDHDAFDQLARRVDQATGRRSLLGVLGGLGLLSAAGLTARDADAGRKKKKKKKKPPPPPVCTPDSRTFTCRGRCGSVQNNCRQSVVCDGQCATCQRCGSQGVCERVATGTPCGGTNSCTAAGRCECDSALCDAFEICAGGVCVICGIFDEPCCENGVCQTGAPCNAGTCEACGRNGEQCCANQICDPGKVCVGGTCRECGANGQPCCSSGSICQNGQCNAGTCP